MYKYLTSVMLGWILSDAEHCDENLLHRCYQKSEGNVEKMIVFHMKKILT